MIRYLILLLFVALPIHAEVITTYQDIESYEAATQRLGRVPLVSEFEHYNYEVSKDEPGGEIVIALVGDIDQPPIVEPEPEPPIIVEPEPEPEPEPPVIVEPVVGLFDRTSKQQMYGCLTRWDNQLNSGSVTTILNSLSSMFDDKEKINNCIDDIKAVIGSAE